MRAKASFRQRPPSGAVGGKQSFPRSRPRQPASLPSEPKVPPAAGSLCRRGAGPRDGHREREPAPGLAAYRGRAGAGRDRRGGSCGIPSAQPRCSVPGPAGRQRSDPVGRRLSCSVFWLQSRCLPQKARGRGTETERRLSAKAGPNTNQPGLRRAASRSA